MVVYVSAFNFHIFDLVVNDYCLNTRIIIKFSTAFDSTTPAHYTDELYTIQ